MGPVSLTLTHHFAPGRLKERWLIHGIQLLAVGAALFLALFWDWTTEIAGVEHSLAYLVVAFLLALLCCTSNVSFLPFMYQFPPLFVRTFFIGQGLSALLPCVLALGQGVGKLECLNGTHGNTSQPHYLEENFSATTFFWLLLGLLAVSALAFLALLLWHKEGGSSPGKSSSQESVASEESFPLQTNGAPTSDGAAESPGPEAPTKPQAPSFWTRRNSYLLVLLGVSSALTNGALPAVQSYSCLPYGGMAYHLSVVLSNIANPVACFVAMFLLCR